LMEKRRWLEGAERVGAGLVIVFGIGAGAYPLLAGPSYEYSLLAGAVLPSLAAACAAFAQLKTKRSLAASVRRGLSYGVSLALFALLCALVTGAVTGLCDPIHGSQFFLLGPGMGVALGGLWGGLAGRISAELVTSKWRYWLALVLAFAGPVSSLLVSLWRFYSSPMIFAFDPFFGFFAGTLYDTVISGLDRLLSYRVGSLGTIVAIGVVAAHVDFDPERRLRFVGTRPRVDATLLGLGGLTISLAVSCNGATLGHYQTTTTIAETLGHRALGARCEVIHSGTILERDAKLLARECDAHVAGLEKYFETPGPEKIRVFLFASAGEKAELMGAANTYIAKPWREEIYIQAAGYPHPVLGHELAHVIAGSFGRGPFKISGPLAGLIPDPGRIEGIAVAASPSEDTDLTLFEWAATMRRQALLPPLEAVFRLSFLGHNSASAYTAAGAFMAFLRESYGASALRRWYAGEAISAVTGGLDLQQVENRFLERLASVEVSEPALNAARARFDRPALPNRRCPHEVDRLEQQAENLLEQNDIERAERLYDELLVLDPDHDGAQLDLGTCDLRRAKLGEAVERYQAIANDPSKQPFQQSAAALRWADVELGRGNGKLARELLERARSSVVDENVLRTIDVKLFAADRATSPSGSVDRAAYEAIVALLVGDFELGKDWATASAKLAHWAALDPSHGLASYLLGKNFWGRGRWHEAAEYLDRALRAGLEIDRVQSEAVRTRLILACALGDTRTATQEYVLYRARSDISSARRDGVRRFAERCGITSAQ
jgi:tetratricopeptide (TPR) repeat protein